MDSEWLFRGLGSAGMVMPVMMWLLVSGPVLYPLARWRAMREPVADPQLGIKVALGYFGFLSFQLVLVGVTMVLFGLLSTGSSSERGDLYRVGFGFLVPGAILLGLHVSALQRSNQEQFPAVRRLCLGYNFVVTGVFGLIATVLAFQALFTKGSAGNFGRFGASAVIVYGAAWAWTGVRLGRMVMASPGSMDPPDLGLPSGMPHPPAAAPPGPAGPSLPSLGGGAFPPIESK